MFFQGKHLRVKTLITSDGLTPLLKNGQAQYRIDYLPFSAKKQMDRKAVLIKKRGFINAVPIVEVVDDSPVVVTAPVQIQSPVAEGAQSEIQF